MMPTLTMCIGLPASGKSSWAKQQDAVRVNKDDIRTELAKTGWVWSHENEKMVIVIRDSAIASALNAGKDVISDDTNFHPSHRERLKQIAADYGAQFVERMFYVPVAVAIDRDSQREGTARVGEAVIRRMAKQYHPLEYAPYPVTPGLTTAILCDLDGTAALMTNRTPYEQHKCDSDMPCEPVREVLWAMRQGGAQPYQIVYMSGRDDTHYEVTQRWLENNWFPSGPLFMRAADDKRDDAVVKEELFNIHVRDIYNVLFVFDDRDRVVKKWRQMGLTCFQVNEGNF